MSDWTLIRDIKEKVENVEFEDGKLIVQTEIGDVEVPAEIKLNAFDYDAEEWLAVMSDDEGKLVISDLETLAQEDTLDDIKTVILRGDDLSVIVTDGVDSATDNTLVADDENAFAGLNLVGQGVAILRGQGSGQGRIIESHTDDTLTVMRDWEQNPGSSSVFAVTRQSEVKFGEVVENPQEYTVLGRLADIQANQNRNLVEGDILLNDKVTFADEAEAGDTQTITIPEPAGTPMRHQMYMIHVYNDSDVAESSINVDLEVTWEDSEENDRTVEYLLFEELSMQMSDMMWEEVGMLYRGGELVITNNDDIGAGEGYDVFVKVVSI